MRKWEITLLEVLVVLLLSVHLICVNVGAAGPVVCVWFEWREGRGCVLAGNVGRYLAAASLLLFIFGMMLGLGIGWLQWSAEYQQRLSFLAARIKWGVWELVFSLVLMAVYVVWWHLSRNSPVWSRVLRCLLPLLAGTNLLYHFPFLFVILSGLSGESVADIEPLDSAGFRRMIVDGELLARSLHLLVASFAASGATLLVYALSLGGGKNRENADRVATWGGRLALAATLLQLPIGLWILMEMQSSTQRQLMGGNPLLSLLLLLAVFAALVLMHQLSALAMGHVSHGSTMRSIATMVIVIVLMTAVSRQAKPVAIDPNQNAVNFERLRIPLSKAQLT